MGYKKNIIILSGGRHSGMVKLYGNFDGVSGVKGVCKLDDNAKNGELYIIGNKIARVKIGGRETQFEIPVRADGDVTCVVSGFELPLVGGTGGSVNRRAAVEQVEGWKKLRAAEEAKQKLNGEPKAGPEPEEEPDEGAETETSGLISEAVEPIVPVPNVREEPAEEEREDKPKRENISQEDTRPAAERVSAEARSDAYSRAVLEEGVVYDGKNFYQAIKPQLDEMFVCYPEDRKLCEIVPNSKWVRVESDGDYYVVGILYDLEQPIYICYGIPGIYSAKPPEEIADVCVWLPLKLENRYGEGYWIIYQSAENGKCIR